MDPSGAEGYLHIVSRSAGTGNQLGVPPAPHDRSAVVVTAQSGISLDGIYPSVDNLLHNAYMLGDLLGPRKVKHDDIAGLQSPADPLAGLFISIGQGRAGGRFEQAEPGLLEHPPDKCHAPGIRSSGNLLAIECCVILHTVAARRGLFGTYLGGCNSQHILTRSHW